MPHLTFTGRSLRATALFLAGAVIAFSASTAGLTTGKAQLKSAGPLAFGPDGILFIGDSLGAAIVAVDTHDNKPAGASTAVDIKGINRKVAALLGTTPEQILINDVKVNPVSKNIYLSVSRGRGPQAIPVILRTDAAGNLKEVPMDNVSFAAVMLPNPPATNPGDPRDPRIDEFAADVDQASEFDAARAGCLAIAAGQTAVEVLLRGTRGRCAFEHLLDEIDAAARAGELIAEQLVGRAGGIAKAAVHALAQDGFGLRAVGGLLEFGAEARLHGFKDRGTAVPD